MNDSVYAIPTLRVYRFSNTTLAHSEHLEFIRNVSNNEVLCGSHLLSMVSYTTAS